MSAAVAKVRLVPTLFQSADISDDFFGRVTLLFPGIKRVYQFRFSKGLKHDGAFRRDQTEYLPYLDMFPIRLEGLKLKATFFLLKKRGEPEKIEKDIPLTPKAIVAKGIYRINLVMDASLRLSATLQKVVIIPPPAPPVPVPHFASASVAPTATAPSAASSPVGAISTLSQPQHL